MLHCVVILLLSLGAVTHGVGVGRRNFIFNLGASIFKVDNQHEFLSERNLPNAYNTEEIRDTLSVSCYVRAKHLDHDVFTLSCPGRCVDVTDQLWGDSSYHEDSYVCAAAIHAGVIEASKGGQISGRKIDSVGTYIGSKRNYVTSQEKNDTVGKAFIFQRAKSGKVPTYSVCCYVKAEQIPFDEFNVICPGGCDALTEDLYGSVEYSSNSYICAAAIHDAKMPREKGGFLKVIKQNGRPSFLAEERNRIQSKRMGSWPSSFILEDIIEKTSTHLKVSCAFRGYHVAEETFTVHCPPGCDEFTDQVWGTGVYTVDSYVCAAAIHDGKISAGNGGEVTLHRVKGSMNFVGSGKNGVMTQTQEADVSHGFFFMEPLTRSNNLLEATCTMQANYIRNEVATVICPKNCVSKTSNLWGYGTYREDSYVCAAAILDGKITNKGGPVTIRKLPSQQYFTPATENEVTSKAFDMEASAFKFEDIFQEVNIIVKATCDFTANHVASIMFTIDCPAGCDVAGGQTFGDGIYTPDSRLCQAAIHDGRITSLRGGFVTVYVDDGITSFGQSRRNGVQSSHSPEWDRFVSFSDNHFEQKRALVATCTTQSKWIQEQEYTVICPANCSNNKKLYGTQTYSDDSYVCAAAIHDGRVNASTGGQVDVRKIPGLKTYAEMTENGIASKNKGKYPKAFEFYQILDHKESTFTVSCALEGIIIQEKTYSIICPPGCDKMTGRVWGYETYTDDSYICAAAIQAGKINERGGRVNVKRTETSTFGASEKNGVESKAFEGNDTSAAFNFL